MSSAFYSKSEYKQKQSEITKRNWLNGTFNFKIKPFEARICTNPNCNKSFEVKPYREKVFCSSKCAAVVNNSKRPKKVSLCIVCNKPTKRHGYTYCSVLCQSELRFRQFILRWKEGLESGTKGVKTRFTSNHIRRYLIQKYGEKCSECGWNKRNTSSGRVPLEVDHKDGKSENNLESNLRLLCPNCHSLTPYFRNLNKGNGRSWRMAKYIKNDPTLVKSTS